jgi:ribosomal protein S18 acetylase RimI-like enzyme
VSVYRIAPLGQQSRRGFACGSAALDRYFQDQVTQDVRRRIAACFVATVAVSDEIAGFYTLSATSLAFDRLTPARAKKLPRYPVVPAILLGRLAVASNHQGRQLGAALVADAVLRSTRSDVVGHLMVVDAKDDAAARFYQRLGFEQLADDSARLILVL